MKVYINTTTMAIEKRNLASEGYKTSPKKKKKLDSFHEKYMTITQKLTTIDAQEEKNDCTHSHYMHTQINDK